MKQAKISWKQDQPFSDEFDDVYFSTAGGIAETEYVFLQQNHIAELWQGRDHFVIAETGFGTGLNFLTTVMHWLKNTHKSSQLHYISVEKYPLSKQDLQQALLVWPEFKLLLDELLAAYPPAIPGYHQRLLFDGRVSLQLLQGDVIDMLGQLNAQVDAWYLDGFAPDKNPEMWSEKVFEQIARLSHEGSRFSTYTAAGFVRRGLHGVGFEVNKVKGFGTKREMLSGRMGKKNVVPNFAPWFFVPENNTASKRVAVIGAGIAGVTTACVLASQGWQVELIEKHGSIASEASGNLLGVVLPRLGMDDSVETKFYVQAYFKAIYKLDQLSRQFEDEQFSWRQTGVIQLASSARIKKYIENIDCIKDLAQVIDADQASRLAGINIKDDALFYPAAGYISPENLCQIMLDMAGSNINLHLNREIKTLKQSNNKWLLKEENDRQAVSVDAVVLANAAAVNQFQQTSWMDVQCVRGQISYLPSNKLSQSLRVPVCYEGYVIPEKNGQHVIGATFSPNDCTTEIRAEDHIKNTTFLSKEFPALFQHDAVGLEGRAAVRAVSRDRMPIVGPVANEVFYQQNYADLNKGKPAQTYPDAEYLPGLYVNVAHGARGLTSAFLCAELISAQLNNFPLPVSEKVCHVLHPSRFMVRRLKKGLSHLVKVLPGFVFHQIHE